MSNERPVPQSLAARRRARNEARATGRSAVLGLMLVALAAGMVVLAGTTPRGIGAPVDAGSRVSLDRRTFVCDARIPGSQTVRGTIVAGPRPTRKASGPVVISVDRDKARGAYAAEQASSKRWSAWMPCPEAHARWLFVGASGAAITHDTVLTITNPRTGAAVFDVDVFGPSGPVAGPGLHGRTIAGGTTQILDLGTVAPKVGELAVSVVAQRGLVAVSAADTFSPGAVGKPVREWLPATSLPAKVVTLSGLTPKPTGATLLVFNPGDVDAVAQVQVIGSTGTFTPAGMLPVTVAPHSVQAVPLTSVFNGSPLAIRVTGSTPLTATVRASRNNDIAFAAGVGPIRGATALALPAGNARQLVLSSIGKAGSVTLTGYDVKANRVLERTVVVPAGTSVAVKLGAQLAYLRLASSSGTVIGGLSTNAAHSLITAGVAPAIRSIRLPVVIPGW